MIIDAFAPGDQVSMPITLVTRNDPQVAKIFLEVGYTSELISFVEATLGGGADGQLVIKPVQSSRYELKRLLSKVTKDNVHREISSGDPQGKEAW